MKPRKASDLRALPEVELLKTLREAEETLSKQRFQHALKQLHDTAYLKTLRKDIARMHTILSSK
ncbi:MAG: 50S ribosomal protein L29 [Ignavibacteria bacterium]|jgi:large subunit ribosomal protein L29|nr:50S ribosomal protein L29 [Ignavibacteria bacterium]